MAGCWVDEHLVKCPLNGKHWDEDFRDYDVTSFQFHSGGALGHISSSFGLSTTTGQQVVSAMRPGYRVSASIARGN